MTATTTKAPEVNFKLGKLPARPDAVKLKMTRYLVPAELPTPPANFGHDAVVGNWQMLGNDTVGDCVIAGGLHETMLWTANGSKQAKADTAAAIKNYSAITGYDLGGSGRKQPTIRAPTCRPPRATAARRG